MSVELLLQIEAMQCCGNCKHRGGAYGSHCLLNDKPNHCYEYQDNSSYEFDTSLLDGNNQPVNNITKMVINND